MKRLDKKTRMLRIKEGWGVFFLLGIVMLNYPFLHIFNKPQDVLGVPLMVLYLFVGWPISIYVIYLFSRFLVNGDAADRPNEENGEEPE